jgi:hypothetical protein
MMSDEELCLRWRRFLGGEDEGAVFDDELLDHVEVCRPCQANVQAAGEPETIWRRLAGEAGEDELLARTRLAERYDHQRSIASAVEQQLMPSLSSRVQAVWGALDPLALFRGIDAVALLVRAFPDPDEVPPELVLRDGSEVWASDKSAIPRSTIEAEVARSTSTAADGRGASGRGVMSPTAVPRFVQWLPQAARDNANLFLGVRSAPKGTHDAMLTIVDRDNAADLHSHWFDGRSRRRREVRIVGTPEPRRSRVSRTAEHNAQPFRKAPDGTGIGLAPFEGAVARTKTGEAARSAVSRREDHVHHTPTKPLPAIKRMDDE